MEEQGNTQKGNGRNKGEPLPALHKLEAEGLLDVEVAKVDNRLRKYYKLTEQGEKETVNRLAVGG